MTLPAGSRIGAYEVRELLGLGGMGEVYRAHDPRLGRDVALKVLVAGEARHPSYVARFQREARAASALSHPNILTVYEIGEEEGRPFIAMELVEGSSLEKLVRSGPVAWRRALEIAVQVADGLARAHEAGIVHRDLKPENVMLTREGWVKLVDFGIAKVDLPGDADQRLTQAGLVVGTAGYMSPEQARGLPVDHRSDQFALGSLLLEMLTGRPAFDAPSVGETMVAVLQAEPQGLSDLPGRVPDPLVWTLTRLLSKEPDQRWVSTRDLASELRVLLARLGSLAGAAVASPTPAASPAAVRSPSGEGDASAAATALESVPVGGQAGPMRPASASVRRAGSGAAGPSRADLRRAAARMRIGAGVAVAAGLLLAGIGGGFLLARRSVPPVVVLSPLTSSGSDSAPSAGAAGRILAFVSARDGTPRIWLKDLVTLAEQPATAGPDDAPRLSPTGGDILFVRDDGERRVLCRLPTLGAGAEPRPLVAGVVGGDWMPDGKHVAFVRWAEEGGQRVSEVGIADADGGNEKVLARVKGRALAAPRVSPDGSRIAVTASAARDAVGGVLSVDVASGTVRELVPSGDAPHLSSVAWTPDGHDVVVSRSESRGPFAFDPARGARLLACPVAGGAPRELLGLPGQTNVLDLLPDGSAVVEERVVQGSLSERDLSPTGAAAAPRELTRGNGVDREPVYAPDGKAVLFSSNRTSSWDVWRLSLGDLSLQALGGDRSDERDPAWLGRAGGRVVWSSNRSGAFQVVVANADGSGARTITPAGVDARSPTATADGRTVFYSSATPGQEGIWRLASDGSGATRIVTGRAAFPDVSPDGERVLYAMAEEGRTWIRVVPAGGGPPVPFQVDAGLERPDGPPAGRARWTPDGTSIAFVAPAASGRLALFLQKFDLASRRLLVAEVPGADVETFGISPDGRRVVVGTVEVRSILLRVSGLPGIRAKTGSAPAR